MQTIWEMFRSGSWVSPDRIKAYCLILLPLEIAIGVAWILLSDGFVDLNGTPIGSDFSSFHAAATLAVEGRPLDAYIPAEHLARQQSMFGPDAKYFAFAYPPIFLLMIAPLGWLTYPVALATFQLMSILIYLHVIGRILRNSEALQLGLLAAFVFPAVFINLGHGQNALLAAALFGGALLVFRERPVLGGILFGLLAFKPQLGLFIPFALVAGGYWRCFATASVTVIAVSLASLAAFGMETWLGFFKVSALARELLLEEGAVGFEKLQTLFAAIRLWGGSVPLAYVAQAVLALGVLACIMRSWRKPIDHDAAGALLIIGTLLASPHILDYDLTLLAPALALLVRSGLSRGFRNWELTFYAAIWAMPLVARQIATYTHIPIGFGGLIVLFALATFRCSRARIQDNQQNPQKDGLRPFRQRE